MDAWSIWLRLMGVPTLDYAMLGRWGGHWFHGIWRHQSIQEAPAIRGEKKWGWAMHYLTGIAFAFALACAAGPQWLREPTLVPALWFGAISVLLPWLVLQPALGAGVAASRTSRPWLSRATSLATHLVFGLGLFLAAKILA
ncbi:DUF2938 domain-containing protein [Diaphorobacter aerolatus]|nr:DUF2938 domain-containing protein [Diaphorobacter aerolatus]